MTIRQKQWQLYYLGFYGESVSDIDGIWGAKSEAAARAFQQFAGLKPVDGIFGIQTEKKSNELIRTIQTVIGEYLPLQADGLAGQLTVAATSAYQLIMGLPATGLAEENTRAAVLEDPPDLQDSTGNADWWKDIRYFTREEFRCKCGGRYCSGYPAEMQETVVRLCDRARIHFGRPGHIVSGLRCPRHNANEGGVPNSQHIYGEAVDLYIEGISADALYSFLTGKPQVRYTYKINGRNVHFDIPKRER